jgi:phytoene desaturase
MTQNSSKPVGIVGGGLGGLASACVLAARGHKVVLFEKSPWLGGKAAVLEADGYRFDMGPTIVTLPSVLKRIFAEAGKNIEQYLDLVLLDPQWRCFYDDGTTLDLRQKPSEMYAELDKFAPGSAEGYRRFLEYSAKLNDISQKYFFYRSVGSMWDMFKANSLFSPGLIADMINIGMGKSVASCVRSHVPDPKVAQMLDHFTQYVGSSPELSPAVLCSIAHMQTDEGIWYPIGGTRAVPVALAKLASELGVDLRPGCGIRRILTDTSERATGVETESGEKIELAAVVSNSDSVRTHRELLSGSKASGKFEKRRKYEAACSGVVLYLGLDKRYEQLVHHNFVFSHNAEEEFEAIYHKGIPAPDPTCYVCAPAITEPGVAPPGGEALYILVHTPYLRPGQDWSKMLPDYRRVILQKLASTAGMTDLESHIKFESFLTPQDIHDRYRVLNGAIYGLASHGKYAGAFKPANRSQDIPGLYLAGGSAHPGPGMPMALMSGWIAADVLDIDARAGVVTRPARTQPV